MGNRPWLGGGCGETDGAPLRVLRDGRLLRDLRPQKADPRRRRWQDPSRPSHFRRGCCGYYLHDHHPNRATLLANNVKVDNNRFFLGFV